MVLLLAGCIINAEVYERRKAELTDADGDGFAMEDECDDDDATIFPGADESCDGVDQDCDGEVDEGASDAATWHPDEDGDGYGEAGGAVVRCDSPGRAFSNTADDCDDADPYSYPGATEVEYDGVDQDCSGADLDDLDGDGYANADDCDEGDAAVHPGAAELWANAFADDDCDGALDQDEPLLFGDSLWYSTVADAALGTRVRGYVDVDGDGAAEVLTTAVATTRTHSRSGAVYLLSPSGSGDVDAGALRTIDAGGSNWYLGVATDTRDLDGDGLPEVLASASGVDTTGAGYLVAGASLAARDLFLPGDASHVFTGSEPNTYWGSDIAFLGDIDGDGSDEVAMSAVAFAAGGLTDTGRVVAFSLAHSTHSTGEPDFAWDGYYERGRFGETVVSVGDVDNDGLPDTLVSAEAGDIFAVLPAVSGSILDVYLSRVTRDGDTSGYRTVPVGDLDGADGPDVMLLASDKALVFTGLGTFSLRTQADAWMTINADVGSQFADAVDLGDRNGDGLPETLLSRTWSPGDSTSWAGVLLGTSLAWHAEIDAETLDISVLSTRSSAGHGYRAALVGGEPGVLAFGGYADDRGAVGGGSVGVVAMPE